MTVNNNEKLASSRCGAKTNKGTACRNRVKNGQNKCHLHLGAASLKTTTSSSNGHEELVVIHQSSENSKFELLTAALSQAGFWKKLETTRKSRQILPSEFKIVIKPDLEIFDPGAPTGTDPQLVEHLISLLHKKGYSNVAVADGVGSADLWLENRDVMALADLVGYRYVTDDDEPYDVISLSEDLIDVDFPESGALVGSKLSRTWVEADFRINIAKNKTHEENFFSLCLQNLLNVLPKRDKDYHYHHRLKSWDVCLDLLKALPVNFSIIDAHISNHGSDGIRSINPIKTNTIIASENILLADWAASLKMGLDPYASRLNAAALRNIGLPKKYKIKGDLTPYPDWQNVSLILSDSVRKRNRCVYVQQLTRPWFQTVNSDLFPFKNPVDEKINQFITKFFSRADKHPIASSAITGLNYLLAAAHNFVESWQVIYNKDKLRHQKLSLGFDTNHYTAADYEAVVDYMQPLAQIASQTPPDKNGLRWRYIDGSVLFEFSRILPIKFDDFVSRVDISGSVRMMNDFVGGACVPVCFDSDKRIIHQAERNIYLPQPNWMVIFGGLAIDVGKLEFLRYEKNRQQIFWRTVTSENKSADFDDGIVTFEKTGKDNTTITIVARQKFALPLFWQVVNVDLIPQIKDSLVSDAYTTFFSRTMANFEAAYERRPLITGQPWKSDFAEPESCDDKMPLDELKDILAKFVGFLEPLINHFQSGSQDASAGHTNDSQAIDELGNTIRTFFSDLFDALKKDYSLLKTIPEETHK